MKNLIELADLSVLQKGPEIVYKKQPIGSFGHTRDMNGLGQRSAGLFDCIRGDGYEVHNLVSPNGHLTIAGLHDNQVIRVLEGPRLESRPRADIQHRDNRPPNVDDAFHDRRRLGKRHNGDRAQDLPDIRGQDTPGLPAYLENEHFNGCPADDRPLLIQLHSFVTQEKAVQRGFFAKNSFFATMKVSIAGTLFRQLKLIIS